MLLTYNGFSVEGLDIKLKVRFRLTGTVQDLKKLELDKLVADCGERLSKDELTDEAFDYNYISKLPNNSFTMAIIEELNSIYRIPTSDGSLLKVLERLIKIIKVAEIYTIY